MIELSTVRPRVTRSIFVYGLRYIMEQKVTVVSVVLIKG